MAARLAEPSFLELFTPKLVTVLREGYGLADLRADAISGLTVAIVALPLSMAIAIASGVTPDMGLYTSIIGGFLVSALGGSRFQIGGPAGAFIVLVSATVAQHGIDGLILATLLSGIIIAAIGLLRLGTFIKYIPFPVTVGFTTGIAVIIFASQIKDLLGLSTRSRRGSDLRQARRRSRRRCRRRRCGNGDRRSHHRAPSSLSAAIVRTGRPSSLRWRWRRSLPRCSACRSRPSARASAASRNRCRCRMCRHSRSQRSSTSCRRHCPSRCSAASKACCRRSSPTSMSGRRHRSNCELVAQGVANIASALFGGFCVTGNIARTATNVRSGRAARSRECCIRGFCCCSC